MAKKPTYEELEQRVKELEKRSVEDKRTEKELRETEDLFQKFFDCANIGLALTTPKKGFTRVNACMCQMLGYSEDELREKSWPELTHPEDLEADETQHKRVLANEIDTYEMDKRFIRKDGTIVHTYLTVSCIRNPDASVRHTIGSLEDITSRKLAEEALKTQARILDSMVEGVNVSDENAIIFFTNPAFDRIFGYKRSELIGKHVSILNSYLPEENARIIGEIIERLKTEGVWSGESNNIKKDGTTFTTYAHVSALEISGKQYWISVQEDITDRKQAEEALRKSELELKTRNRIAEIFLTSPDDKMYEDHGQQIRDIRIH